MATFRILIGMTYEAAERTCTFNGITLIFECEAMSPYYWNDGIYTMHDKNGKIGRLKVRENKVIWATIE